MATEALVVIRGPSGAGKSTLLETLAGLRPAIYGHLTLKSHGTDGSRSERELHLSPQCSLPCDLTTYVAQRPFLFAGSLRANLTLGARSALSDEHLWMALELVSMAGPMNHAGGLAFAIADGGKNLSEGQKYRLALARALLQPRPFLLLDEPFASLDDASITAVIGAIAGAVQRMGVVIVSHIEPYGLHPAHIINLGNFNTESIPIPPMGFPHSTVLTPMSHHQSLN